MIDSTCFFFVEIFLTISMKQLEFSSLFSEICKKEVPQFQWPRNSFLSQRRFNLYLSRPNWILTLRSKSGTRSMPFCWMFSWRIHEKKLLPIVKSKRIFLRSLLWFPKNCIWIALEWIFSVRWYVNYLKSGFLVLSCGRTTIWIVFRKYVSIKIKIISKSDVYNFNKLWYFWLRFTRGIGKSSHERGLFALDRARALCSKGS